MDSCDLFTQILQGLFTDIDTIPVSVTKSSKVESIVNHNKA